MVFDLMHYHLQVDTMDQDMSYHWQLPGAAVNQEDPTGSGGDLDNDDDLYNLSSRPDPGCQDLDNSQDNDLDQDQDLGDMPETNSDEGNLFQTQGLHEGPEKQSSNLIEELSGLAILDTQKITIYFIEAIKSASLDDEHSELDSSILEHIRNPPTSIPSISDEPGMHLGLDIFLALTNAAQGTYTSVWNAILKRYPEDEIPSYEQVKKYISNITGVFSIAHDMCINSCLAFTGPFKKLNVCPECAEV